MIKSKFSEGPFPVLACPENRRAFPSGSFAGRLRVILDFGMPLTVKILKLSTAPFLPLAKMIYSPSARNPCSEVSTVHDQVLMPHIPWKTDTISLYPPQQGVTLPWQFPDDFGHGMNSDEYTPIRMISPGGRFVVP